MRTVKNVLKCSGIQKVMIKTVRASYIIALTPYKCQKVFLRTKKSKKCFKRIPRNREASTKYFCKISEFENTQERSGTSISFWNTKGDDKDGRFINTDCNVPYKDQKVFLRTQKVKSESGRNLEIEKSEENIFAKFWNLRIVKNALFSGA